MRYLVIGVALSFFFPALTGFACETDMELNGYEWTFHRMNDGNRYHEVRNLGEFTEGDTLRLTAPCKGHYVDTIQVDWEDDRSEVQGELVVMPGNTHLGSRDISGKRRESWAVRKSINGFRINFSGPRGHRCRVRFIRVFYGPDSEKIQQKQPHGKIKHLLVDKITLQDGAAMRKARFLRWDGTHLYIAVKTPGGQTEKKYLPGQIRNLVVANRWGKAVAKDGTRYPIRIKSMEGAMIHFEKKLDGAVVPKPETDIHNFSSITFK